MATNISPEQVQAVLKKLGFRPTLEQATILIDLLTSITIAVIREQAEKQLLADELEFNYDLITVNTIPALSPIDVARGLMEIHCHSSLDDQGNSCIVYKEPLLLDLLKSWGLPEPDWDGYAKTLIENP